MSKLGPLSTLVNISREACDVLAPLVRLFYGAINSETSKLKADKSVFTIADGIVQHMLAEHLFKDKFKAIVGEENVAVNITMRPYTVDDLVVPSQFDDQIDKVLVSIRTLAAKVNSQVYLDKTVFIDPIDGTREFATGKGEQCSILIGFVDETGNPCAGFCYRPIPNPPTFAGGCLSEDKYILEQLDMAAVPNKKGLLTTNGAISAFTVALLDELKFDQIKAGGAGNKMLMLMEGKAVAYIQDRGVSRWDSCAAQAVFEAKGGKLLKLRSLLQYNNLEEKYTYKKTTVNLDFEPGVSLLNNYNSVIKDPKKDDKAIRVEQVVPYANLMGLFAVNNVDIDTKQTILKALKSAALKEPPSYD